MCELITRERAHERLKYDAETGRLLWASAAQNKGHVIGREAGRIEANGYRHVKVDGKLYASHRLIWLMAHGTWPVGVIDHIDGNRTNNRISNLRDVDAQSNAMNRTNVRKDSTSGLIGVYQQRGRWYAYANKDGKKISLGGFETMELAAAARREFKQGEIHV